VRDRGEKWGSLLLGSSFWLKRFGGKLSDLQGVEVKKKN
jgi:hypothetical protein